VLSLFFLIAVNELAFLCVWCAVVCVSFGAMCVHLWPEVHRHPVIINGFGYSKYICAENQSYNCAIS